MKEDIIDFTAMCNCGWENYTNTKVLAMRNSKEHVAVCPSENPEVYIDKNVNFEIDDTFKSIIISK